MIRPKDVPAPEPEAEPEDREGGGTESGEDDVSEALLAGKGLLPSLLRVPVPVEAEIQAAAQSLTEQGA